MAGIIWFVQVVHYPLFALAGRESFGLYEAQHATRTGWVVAPLMCVELGTTLLFLFSRLRPAAVPAVYGWVGAALVLLIWLSTFFVQVPLHNRLSAGYDPAAAAQLVATNWVRTVAWTARAILMLLATARVLR
jgi:hypothetical protein